MYSKGNHQQNEKTCQLTRFLFLPPVREIPVPLPKIFYKESDSHAVSEFGINKLPGIKLKETGTEWVKFSFFVI